MLRESPEGFSKVFEKTIFCGCPFIQGGKKMCELRVNVFDVAMATANLMKVWPNNQPFLDKIFYFLSFLYQITEIYKCYSP